MWRMTRADQKRLNVFQRTCLRRILKMHNESVKRRAVYCCACIPPIIVTAQIALTCALKVKGKEEDQLKHGEILLKPRETNLNMEKDC